jgi:hypothetical protein
MGNYIRYHHSASTIQAIAMELTINVPALLFPGITLLMLAYTNRFLGLASLIRNLHDKLRENKERPSIVKQIRNLRLRLHLIRYMQLFGAFSFALCLVCMFCIYQKREAASKLTFLISLSSLFLSLLISLWEIQISTRALDYELSDMEDIK